MDRIPLKLPLKLKTEALTRTPLRLVQEMGDADGYYRSMAGLPLDQNTLSGDPIEDAKLHQYMVKRQREAEFNRARRIQRLRRLARMDFKLVGGVAPVGYFSGFGGGDAMMRPSSISPRI